MFNFSENKKSLDEKLYLPRFGIELQYSKILGLLVIASLADSKGF